MGCSNPLIVHLCLNLRLVWFCMKRINLHSTYFVTVLQWLKRDLTCRVFFTGSKNTGLYWAVLGYTGLYWDELGYSRLYWDLLGFTRLYRAVVGCRGLYWAVVGAVLCWNGLYWAVVGFGGLYWPVLDCSGLLRAPPVLISQKEEEHDDTSRVLQLTCPGASGLGNLTRWNSRSDWLNAVFGT